MVIVGLDPGRKQTGFCVLATFPILTVLHLERLDNEVLKQWMWMAPIDVVIMENYRVYKWVDLTGNELQEVRLIGAVEEICHIREVPLVEVQPSQHKTRLDDKSLGRMVNFGGNTHLRDAIRVSLWGLGFTAPEGRTLP